MSFTLSKQMSDLREMVELDIQSRSAHKSDILNAVTEQIKATVNGKIDKIAVHLTGQDTLLQGITTEQERVKNELTRLKSDTDPFINFKKIIMAFIKGVVWTCGAVVSLGGAWLVVKQLFK